MNIAELAKKFPLKGEKDTAVALDIGKDSVKLVQLKREGETIRLSRIDSARLAGTSATKAISRLLDKNQIESKDVILGTNGQSVFMKFLEVLPVGAQRLEQTIKYEAQQQIPFSLDEVEWDTHLLAQMPKDKSSAYRALLVAIKKDNLLSKKVLAEEVDLRPTILDVSSLSIYNCIRFNQDYDKDKFTAVLNMGAASTDLLLLKGDDFWMRSFAHTSALEDLGAEITRSIEYYQSVRVPSTLKVEEILLSGGAALTPGVDRFLAEKFSCKVRSVEPFKMLQCSEPIKSKLDSKSKVLFAQAVGLALRGLDKSSININLLKEQIQAKTLAHQRFAYAAGSVILALLILFGASTFMRRDYREKSFRLQHLKKLVKTFSTYGPQLKELQSEEKLLSRQVNLLHHLAQNRALWLEVLLELGQMLPDDLWITGFVGTENELQLQGKAGSYGDVNSFVSRLKSSLLFSEIKPLSSSFIEDKEKRELVKFSISMSVSRAQSSMQGEIQR